MNVIFLVASASLAGGTRVVVELAEHLRRRGHQTRVVFPSNRPSAWARLKAAARGRRPAAGDPDLSYFRQPGVEVPYTMVDRPGPLRDRDVPDADVVVATFWATAEWVAGLSPAKGRKVYFIQQYEANFGHQADRVDATWRLPLRKVVCSGWLADLAKGRFGDARAAVVPNGINTLLFHAPPRGKQTAPTVGLMYAPTNPVKGTSTALEVVAAARRRLPGLRVRAFGTGPVSPTAPLPEGSEYWQCPPQTRLREIYAGCDVWLCTSTSEGFHLPPHEAMACRCPVVSTRVGGPDELVEPGVSGHLTEVGDVAALAGGLVDVLTADEARWRRMSDAALAGALRFTWEAAAARFEEAIAG